MRFDANSKALPRRKRACVAQHGRTFPDLRVDLGREESLTANSRVAGETMIGDRMEQPWRRVRYFKIDDGGERARPASDKQGRAGIAHEHGLVRACRQVNPTHAFVDDKRAAIDAINPCSGDKRGARPLQGGARVPARQAKRASDESAETGIEQAAPVDLQVSRHRDC